MQTVSRRRRAAVSNALESCRLQLRRPAGVVMPCPSRPSRRRVTSPAEKRPIFLINKQRETLAASAPFIELGVRYISPYDAVTVAVGTDADDSATCSLTTHHLPSRR